MSNIKIEKDFSRKIEKQYKKRSRLVKILTLVFIIIFIFSFLILLSLGDPYIIPLDVIWILFRYRFGDPSIVFPIVLFSFLNNNFYRIFELCYVLVFEIRMPRILLAFIVGLSLSISGIVMQGIFRNPLADPYILGVSSGGGLGATLAIYFKVALILKVWTFATMMNYFTIDVGYAYTISDLAFKLGTSLFSFLFACLITFLIYFLARTKRTISIETLLLAGIALSYIFASITQILLLFSREEIHQMFIWGIGGFSGAEWLDVIIVAPITVFLTIVLLVYGKDINVMVFGDDMAKSMGTNIQKTRRNLIILVSLMTSLAVAFTGPIGFVGLICPHILRLIVGNNHRSLMPLAALFGGLFLIWMDFIAQTGFYAVDNNLVYITAYIRTALSEFVPPQILDYILGGPTLAGDIPVGIITSLIGGPFFIILLLTKRKKIFM